MLPTFFQPLRTANVARPLCSCGHAAATHMRRDQFCMSGECECSQFAIPRQRKRAA